MAAGTRTRVMPGRQWMLLVAARTCSANSAQDLRPCWTSGGQEKCSKSQKPWLSLQQQLPLQQQLSQRQCDLQHQWQLQWPRPQQSRQSLRSGQLQWLLPRLVTWQMGSARQRPMLARLVNTPQLHILAGQVHSHQSKMILQHVPWQSHLRQQSAPVQSKMGIPPAHQTLCCHQQLCGGA